MLSSQTPVVFVLRVCELFSFVRLHVQCLCKRLFFLLWLFDFLFHSLFDFHGIVLRVFFGIFFSPACTCVCFETYLLVLACLASPGTWLDRPASKPRSKQGRP